MKPANLGLVLRVVPLDDGSLTVSVDIDGRPLSAVRCSFAGLASALLGATDAVMQYVARRGEQLARIRGETVIRDAFGFPPKRRD